MHEGFVEEVRTEKHGVGVETRIGDRGILGCERGERVRIVGMGLVKRYLLL